VINGREVVLLTRAQVFNHGERLILRQVADPLFDADIFESATALVDKRDSVKSQNSGLFQHFTRRAAERKIPFGLAKTKDFGNAPMPLLGPKEAWRSSSVAMSPEESSFAQAAEWRVTIPQGALSGLSDAYLAVRYQGDVARLLMDERLLTDNFFNGTEWRIGLKRFLPGLTAGTFTLRILPLSEKAPIFFEPGMSPSFGKNGQSGSLQSVDVLPEYEVDVSL
jgi:hypothetical protein